MSINLPTHSYKILADKLALNHLGQQEEKDDFFV